MWETTFTRGWDHRICHVIYVEDYLTNNPCVRRHMRSGLETQYDSLTTAASSSATVLQNLNYRLLVSEKLSFISFLTSRQMHLNIHSKVEVLLGCWAYLTWLWKVSGRWRGELPIGETPAEGWVGRKEIENALKDIEKKTEMWQNDKKEIFFGRGRKPIGETPAEGWGKEKK